MATGAQVAEHRAANAGVVALATRDLNRFWGTLDLDDPRAARNALLRFTPVLVAEYGQVAAKVAADWYDDLRDAVNARGRYRAVVAEPVAAEVVEARTRYGAGHLFTPDPRQTRVFLATALAEYVLQPGRDTITLNADRDPAAAGWQRITRPTRTYVAGCNFCQMLADRGGVYRRATVKFAAHGGCNCVAAPSWDPDAPEVGVEQYRASERMEALRRRAAAGDESAQAQLDAHRERVRDWVAANLDD